MAYEKKGPVKIPEAQAKLMESAEKSWFILSVSLYFYNLHQLLQAGVVVPLALGGETVRVNIDGQALQGGAAEGAGEHAELARRLSEPG